MAVFRLLLMFVFCGFSSAFLDAASPSSYPVYQKTSPYLDRHYITEHNQYGLINTPNYPGNYPDNTVYVYDIGGLYNDPVRLTFKTFNVEYCLGCHCDNVTIKPSHHEDNVQVYCGFTLPHGDGVLYFSGPIQLRFRSNSAYSNSGFQATYEIGALASTPGIYPSTVTSLPPASKCPPATCITCGPGYESRIMYPNHCPECVCVPASSSSDLPPASKCPPATCITCRPGYESRIIYPNHCPECVCVPASSSSGLPPASNCPPATCITCGPGYESRIIYLNHCPECVCVPVSSSSALPVVSTCPPATCPTCNWGYEPRINYRFSCPFCECVKDVTSASPFSIWTTSSTRTFPTPVSHSWAPASTWPPVSTYPPPRSILGSLFRIHGELSDLQDKARMIDNDVINLIQQIEGGKFRQRRSLLLGAIADPRTVKEDVAQGSDN